MILSILLYKSCIWETFYSWVIFRKVVDKSDCRILWSHISPDGMTGSRWYFACWQIAWRRKNFNQIFYRVRCSKVSQRLQCHLQYYRMKNRVKRKNFRCIFNSQFIAASHLVQSDCSVYWSAGSLQRSLLSFFACWDILK